MAMSSAFGGGAALLLRLASGSLHGLKPMARQFSSSLEGRAALKAPDVSRLADAARISLTLQEAEEFAPKIGRVIDWFGQLQAVNLESIEPSLRADKEVSTSQREDIPETFGNREAIIAAIPSYDSPYIKVPKVLNKE